MEIKTVENLSEKIANCENEDYIKSLLQDTATEKNYNVSYNKNNETLYIDQKDYSLIKNLTPQELKELETHIISTYTDKAIIYGYIKLSGGKELRVFNGECV